MLQPNFHVERGIVDTKMGESFVNVYPTPVTKTVMIT